MFSIIIITIFILGYMYAKYCKKTITATNNVVKWSFNSNNEQTIINLSEEKIAPGSKGNFEIEIDASGAETAIDYEIIVVGQKNIPDKFKFYAETKNEFDEIINETEEYNSFADLATNNLFGRIEPEANNQIRRIKVYWYWKFDEEDNSNIDSNNGTLFYDEYGNSSLECSLDIEIIGKQA